jgi:formylglycine-generating enzyme
MDKDLRDDMLKLVRYKVLFVRREYEHSFAEQEDLVPDNMDESSFAAWKTAEFIQELQRKETKVPERWKNKNYPRSEFVAGNYLTGLPDEDKKYLRVYFEVLDRYPREKFKYEEQQIRVLEQIRDRVKELLVNTLPEDDPFRELLKRKNEYTESYLKWRRGFSQCREVLAPFVAELFNSHLDMGEFPGLAIDAEALKANFERQIGPFSQETFQRYTGPAYGEFFTYELGTLKELGAFALYSHWDPQILHLDGRRTKKIAGSFLKYIDPLDLPDLSSKTVDLILNSYREDVGLISWVEIYQGVRQQRTSFAYKLPHKHEILWIVKDISLDGKPIENNIFMFSHEWKGTIGEKVYYYMVAFFLEIDFEKNTVKLWGDRFWRALYEEDKDRLKSWPTSVKPTRTVANSIGMKLVEVPAGNFYMGSPATDPDAQPDENPLHLVKISKPFLMGKYPVTFGQFRTFVEETGYQTEGESAGSGSTGLDLTTGKVETKPDYTWKQWLREDKKNPSGFRQTDKHPVVCVSWKDAQQFCEWLSQKEGKQYRLPTEAEWEYACRAGTATRFYSGDDEESLQHVANIADLSLQEKWVWGTTDPPFEKGTHLPPYAKKWDDGYPFTSPVGRFDPNAFGLYDMIGNVGEWCSDWYDPDYYQHSPAKDPQGPAEGALIDISERQPGQPPRTLRVVRGGVWLDPASGFRSADRQTHRRHPIDSAADIGFRVVRVD